jgi:hypothetical protein
MPKSEVREDTRAFILAAHLYVIVVGAFVFAIGSDIGDAAQLIRKTYGG